jgi:A/G-specific adenine glycosylase
LNTPSPDNDYMPPALLNRSSRTKFRAALLRWFNRRRRTLPWRANRNPYGVWISEIMLQQTRVAAVLDHYARFLKRFPDVRSLAKARPASVLAAWSGLGYYRRARMMHAAARQIVREREGRFPATAAEWRELPGIGRYTAAAIASICYDEPCAVVDGNVERIIERLLGSRPGDAWDWANDLLSRRRPGDFNQAMMELGALVCTPQSPQCSQCPVRKWCVSQCRPPAGSTPFAARRKAKAAFGLITQGNRVRLWQRSERATVMPGMWELPPLDVPRPPSPVSRQAAGQIFTLRHAIMNTDYSVTVVRRPCAADNPGEWFTASRAAKLPLTGLARKILKRAGII